MHSKPTPTAKKQPYAHPLLRVPPPPLSPCSLCHSLVPTSKPHRACVYQVPSISLNPYSYLTYVCADKIEAHASFEPQLDNHTKRKQNRQSAHTMNSSPPPPPPPCPLCHRFISTSKPHHGCIKHRNNATNCLAYVCADRTGGTCFKLSTRKPPRKNSRAWIPTPGQV